jgi:hypothetical protein
MFKKLCLAFALTLATASFARATENCSKAAGRAEGRLPVCIAIDAATADTTSATIDTFGFRFNSLGVKVDTSSEVRIKIDCRSYDDGTTTDQWHTCAEDIVNPDSSVSASQAVTLARAYQYRVRITGYVSGTISVFFERYTN